MNERDRNQDAIEIAAELADRLSCDGMPASDPTPPPKPKSSPRRSYHAKKARRAKARPRVRPAITRTRTVWGRRKVDVDGRHYVIEMGVDGVRVTDRGARAHETLRWHTLVKLSARQAELLDRLTPSIAEILRRDLRELENAGASGTVVAPPPAGPWPPANSAATAAETVRCADLSAGVQGGSGQPAAT